MYNNVCDCGEYDAEKDNKDMTILVNSEPLSKELQAVINVLKDLPVSSVQLDLACVYEQKDNVLTLRLANVKDNLPKTNYFRIKVSA